MILFGYWGYMNTRDTIIGPVTMAPPQIHREGISGLAFTWTNTYKVPTAEAHDLASVADMYYPIWVNQ